MSRRVRGLTAAGSRRVWLPAPEPRICLACWGWGEGCGDCGETGFRIRHATPDERRHGDWH